MNRNEYLKLIDETIEKGRYKADWQSLADHPVPDWLREGKLGIFIHWGIYSVPAFGNEWYPRSMYDKNCREFEHHRKTYGEHNVFGYKDFIPMFKAERFSAEEWIELFCKAGAKYVVPVAEHHDGFAMYKTDFNRWNSTEMGPERDVIGELKAACEKAGLTFCASTHRAEHYFFLNTGRTCDSDVLDEAYRDFYGPAALTEDGSHELDTENPYSTPPTEEWLDDWLVRTCELIDKYQPSVLYFDWWIQNQAFKPWLKKLAAYYYNRGEEWGKQVTINYKHEAFPPTVGIFDVERGALTGISPFYWQTDTAIGKQSWGYRADNTYKSSRQIICDFIDIVSKNGSLLLNIGPRSDGTVTEEETKVLLDMGKWLGINGEGIYGSSHWKVFGEGEVNAEAGFFKDGDEKAFTAGDYRFTYKKGNLYVFQMRPDGKDMVIRTLARKKMRDMIISSAELLGYGAVEFEKDENALTVKLPDGVDTEFPLCVKLELA